MVTAADEATIKTIVNDAIRGAFKDYTRDDSDPASKASPGHFIKTIVSNEVREAFNDYLRDDSDPEKKASPGHYFKTVMQNEINQAIPSIAQAVVTAMSAHAAQAAQPATGKAAA